MADAYEYYVTYIGHAAGSMGPSDIIGKMNELGNEGWDLITIDNNTLYFKRLYTPPPIATAPVNDEVPVIGPTTAEVGTELFVTNGNWTGQPTGYAYQWMRDGANIGTSVNNYTVVADDEGHSITCVVTATNAVGSTAAPPSNAVAIPVPVPPDETV